MRWRLDIQTTEGNEEKYTVQEGNVAWVVDECYVSYQCTYRGKEFCMITYEMMKTAGDRIRTVNYVFLPPLGVRLFSLHTLLKHSVEADAVLMSQIHLLWELLMRLSKKQDGQVEYLYVTQSGDVQVPVSGVAQQLSDDGRRVFLRHWFELRNNEAT